MTSLPKRPVPIQTAGCKSIHNRDIPHQLFTHLPTGWQLIGRIFLVERTEVETFDLIAWIEWSTVEIDRNLRVENVLCLPQVD